MGSTARDDRREPAPIVVLMGVAGAGKSTVGRRVAEELGVEFLDADDFHHPDDLESIRRGIPLDDAKRAPWLDRLHAALGARADQGVVLACSALRASYRRRLGDGLDGLRFVALVADPAVLHRRLVEREDHHAGPSLLDSQLDTLELTGDAAVVDATRPVDTVVADVLAALEAPTG